jgi:hypothetical protein
LGGVGNRFSDLINILKGRVSALPFVLHIVSLHCPLKINTTIKCAIKTSPNQKVTTSHMMVSISVEVEKREGRVVAFKNG